MPDAGSRSYSEHVSRWFQLRAQPVREHPAVVRVERILSTAASRCSRPVPMCDGRPAATHALWICACVTFEDAPVWLIYDLDDGIAWERVPGGVELFDLLDARHVAGGHADPADVLHWLQGDAPDPWAGGDGCGDPVVAEEIRRKIHDQ